MISALGINHKTAPVAVREMLAFTHQEIPEVLAFFKRNTIAKELALVSTCNRTEIYAIDATAINLFEAWVGYRQYHLDIKPHIYQHGNESAVQHLMRVAAGLDSMVVGEPQILSQLKEAYRLAHSHGFLGPRLEYMFQKTFMVAKQVRTSTAIGHYPVSVAYAAVKMAKQIFHELSKARVLMIGAGETIELVAQHLQSNRVSKMAFVNRTFSRAKALADKMDAQALDLMQLPKVLGEYDIIISAVDTVNPVVTEAMLKQACLARKRHPIFMVDLGMPRNIEPSLGQHQDVYLYNLDDIQKVIDTNIGQRADEAFRADAMIAQQAKRFMSWLEADSAHAIIKSSRAQAHAIKDELVRKAMDALRGGQPAEKVVEILAHRLTQRLLHAPSARVQRAGQDKEDNLIKAASELLHFE